MTEQLSTEDLPFCDECREGRGFIYGRGPMDSGWCGDCFGGYVDDEMYEAVAEACDTLDAIEEALDAEAALDAVKKCLGCACPLAATGPDTCSQYCATVAAQSAEWDTQHRLGATRTTDGQRIVGWTAVTQHGVTHYVPTVRAH